MTSLRQTAVRSPIQNQDNTSSLFILTFKIAKQQEHHIAELPLPLPPRIPKVQQSRLVSCRLTPQSICQWDQSHQERSKDSPLIFSWCWIRYNKLASTSITNARLTSIFRWCIISITTMRTSDSLCLSCSIHICNSSDSAAKGLAALQNAPHLDVRFQCGIFSSYAKTAAETASRA